MKTLIALAFLSLVSTLATAADVLDQIRVTYDRQQEFKDGRQKIVIFLTNNSGKLFKGDGPSD